MRYMIQVQQRRDAWNTDGYKHSGTWRGGKMSNLHELRLLLRELHLVEAMAAERHLRALPALLGRRSGGRGGRDRRLRQRYSGLVRGEAGYADVVVAF